LCIVHLAFSIFPNRRRRSVFIFILSWFTSIVKHKTPFFDMKSKKKQEKRALLTRFFLPFLGLF